MKLAHLCYNDLSPRLKSQENITFIFAMESTFLLPLTQIYNLQKENDVLRAVACQQLHRHPNSRYTGI